MQATTAKAIPTLLLVPDRRMSIEQQTRDRCLQGGREGRREEEGVGTDCREGLRELGEEGRFHGGCRKGTKDGEKREGYKVGRRKGEMKWRDGGWV